jgi:hypothetical protein
MADGDLRQIFRQHLPRFDWLAVETGLTSLGVPDSNYCYDGHEGWVEMKKANGWRTRVSPAQVGWAERRLRHGGKVFVAIRKRKDLWLYTGWALRDLISGRIDAAYSIGQWTGGPAAWDWEKISGYLVGDSTSK